jgi:hypothetical protein
MNHKSSTATASSKASGSATGKKMASGSGIVNATIGRLPDAHALEAGHLFIKTSTIELSLETIIWYLSGVNPVAGSNLTGGLNARRKREQVHKLLKRRKLSPQAADAWKSAKKAMYIATCHRNWLAHAVPMIIGGIPILHKTRNALAGEAFSTETIRIDDTRKANQYADEALKHLETLMGLI